MGFEVGGQEPDVSIVRLSGGIVADTDLEKGLEVQVEVISTLTGEVVARGFGSVTSVAFRARRDGSGTDRVQTVKAT